ncbi:pilus assembly protein PilP [Thermodesulfobacteriota bacterium]
MHKYPVTTRLILFFLSLFFLFWGCGESTEAPQQPKVVTKKIALKKSSKSKPDKKSSKPKPKTVKKAPVKAVASKPATKKQALKPKSSISTVASASLDKAKGPKMLASLPAGTPAKANLTVERGLYNPKGKINPFEPLFKEEPKAKKTIEKRERKTRVPLTPLEKIDLGQLKLVGIIQADSGNRALVEEASGKGYVIKQGTYIGTQAGRVDRILPDVVIVDEPLLPVDEVDKDSIYDVGGKNFSIYYSKGKRFINIDGKKFEAKISQVEGKAYFVDPKELKLQKPPGEE